MSTDISKIKHVQTGDPTDAATQSQPTRALEARLQALQQQIQSNSNATGAVLLMPNEPVDSQVALLDVVFFNRTTRKFEKATSGMVINDQAQFSRLQSSLALGIVTRIEDGLCDVMIGGVMTWEAVGGASALLEPGETYEPGLIYYLSENFAGKITQYPPQLRIKVLVGSDKQFALAADYTDAHSLDVNFQSPIGMRPVGGLRYFGDNKDVPMIVGFDGLEETDAGDNGWTSTKDSADALIRDWGWMVADLQLPASGSDEFFVMIEATVTAGAVKCVSAPTLADLEFGGSGFNEVTLVNSVVGGAGSNFVYTLLNQEGGAAGTLTFRFLSNDVSVTRRIVFHVPKSFQGWKMLHALEPAATAVVSAGAVGAVNVVDAGIGYLTPPAVVIAPPTSGTTAEAVAVLNEHGGIKAINITEAGDGYTEAPAVSFVTQMSAVSVVQGGSGAVVALTIAGGVITAADVTNGGTGYLENPVLLIDDTSGQGGVVSLQVEDGVVSKALIVDPGSGYSASPDVRVVPARNNQFLPSSVDIKDVTDPAATTPAVLTPTLGEVGVQRVRIKSRGGLLTGSATISVSGGGSPTRVANLRAIVVDGFLEKVQVIDPGAGYTSAPTLTVLDAGNLDFHGVDIVAEIGGPVASVAVSSGGVGYTAKPELKTFVPLKEINVERRGESYTSAGVTIGAPDMAGGVQAVATARLGRVVDRVVLLNEGAGYTQSEMQDCVSNGVQFSEVGITGIPIFRKEAADDYRLVGVEITDAGYGLPSSITASLSETPTGPGATDAELSVITSGDGGVVRVEITNAGSGYSVAPEITITGDGTGARVTSRLQGDSIGLVGVVDGMPTITKPTLPYSPPTGNALQVFDFREDFPSLSATAENRPGVASAYYNIKTDLALQDRYPAVPVEKCQLVMNGVELALSKLEGTGLFARPDTDVGVTIETLLWGHLHRLGMPWQPEHVEVREWAEGDPRISGVTFQDLSEGPGWTHLDEQLIERKDLNRGMLHLAQASRYAATQQVTGIAALSPLKVIDMITGKAVANGDPIAGFALLTLDNQASFLADTDASIDLTKSGTITPIYTNTTQQSVLVTEIHLRVLHQQNIGGLVPVEAQAALIAVGTNAGNYADWAGIRQTDEGDVEGVTTGLYKNNQVKILLPDAHRAQPLLNPGESLQLKVVNPAGNPISSQLIGISVKGHVY